MFSIPSYVIEILYVCTDSKSKVDNSGYYRHFLGSKTSTDASLVMFLKDKIVNDFTKIFYVIF